MHDFMKLIAPNLKLGQSFSMYPCSGTRVSMAKLPKPEFSGVLVPRWSLASPLASAGAQTPAGQEDFYYRHLGLEVLI